MKYRVLTKHIVSLNRALLAAPSINNERSLLRRFLQTAMAGLHGDFGFVLMRDRSQRSWQYVYVTKNFPYTPKTPRPRGTMVKTFNRRQPLYVSDLASASDIRKDAREYMKAAVVIPIAYRKDIYGLLVAGFRDTHRFSSGDKNFSSLVGHSAAQSITINRLHKGLDRFKETLDRTLDVILILDPEDFGIQYANLGAIQMFGYTEKQFYKQTFLDLVAASKRASLKKVMFKRKAATDESQIYETTMVTKRGRRIPVEIYSQRVATENRPARLLVNIRDIQKRKLTERSIARRAFRDGLTGLMNWTSFLGKLDGAISSAKQTDSGFTLLFIDLDKFKFINDVLGHRAGDQLLRQISRRLSSAIKGTDAAGRMGGDEFVILLAGVTDKAEAGPIAKRVQNLFNKPFWIAAQEIYINSSMGVVLYPQDGNSRKELLQHADIALYKAKDESGNSYAFYKAGITSSKHHFALDRELREAIIQKQLVVFYHPQVEIATGRPVGYEALVRWNHPKLGLLKPGVFLPHAEMSGQIIDIGNMMLERAVNDLVRLMELGKHRLSVSVNLSMRHLLQPELVYHLKELLKNRRWVARHLKIELTESMIMKDVELAQNVLGQIKHLGISCVIDDFGSGYTSISYLKRLPIDWLKIDKNFIAGIGQERSDEAIITAMVSLAHQLSLRVVAEGVETPEQLKFLRQCGCDFIQGNLLTKPLPFGKFRQWLEANTSPTLF